MFETELYHTLLILAAISNLSMAASLLHGNLSYGDYTVYRWARRLVALCFTVFAIGFFLHAHFEWRTTWPAAASALSVSYFHVGGVLFGWSHTSLLRPDYLTKKVVLRDLIILVVGLMSYWTAVANFSLFIFHFSLSIFFLHAAFIAYTFYHTYHTVRRDIMSLPAETGSRRWWTPAAKRTVLTGHHSFVISGHLIVLFGIGSIVVTSAFPTQITPYTVLLCLGIAVFCYIFYALTEYGYVIEAATYATEDAERIEN